MNDIIRKTAGVIVFNGNRVLLVEHKKKAKTPDGLLGIPSGGIKGDETEEQCAIREFKEETGLDIEEDDLITFPGNLVIDRIEVKGDTDELASWRIFICRKKDLNDEDLSGEEDETEPVWVDLDDLKSVTLKKNVEKVIERARAFLEGREPQEGKINLLSRK